ncbi:MAG: hypothetical protein DIU54_014875 [Acidobacteriota bacterium]
MAVRIEISWSEAVPNGAAMAAVLGAGAVGAAPVSPRPARLNGRVSAVLERSSN